MSCCWEVPTLGGENFLLAHRQGRADAAALHHFITVACVGKWRVLLCWACQLALIPEWLSMTEAQNHWTWPETCWHFTQTTQLSSDAFSHFQGSLDLNWWPQHKNQTTQPITDPVNHALFPKPNNKLPSNEDPLREEQRAAKWTGEKGHQTNYWEELVMYYCTQK